VSYISRNSHDVAFLKYRLYLIWIVFVSKAALGLAGRDSKDFVRGGGGVEVGVVSPSWRDDPSVLEVGLDIRGRGSLEGRVIDEQRLVLDGSVWQAVEARNLVS
jgi:hypothetical protein